MDKESLLVQKLHISSFEESAYHYKHLIDTKLTIVDSLITFYDRTVHFGDVNLHVSYTYLLAQLISGAQGACFVHLEDLNKSDLDGIVGKPVLDVIPFVPNYIKVVLLDALYSHINEVEGINPSYEYQLRGTASKKSSARAKKLIKLLGVTKGCKLAIIGLVANIARIALEKGAEVRIADLAEAGTKVLNLAVEYDAIPLIEWADIAIITGNTLKTNTLGQLVSMAAKHSTKVMIYAMTGHNIAPRYLNHGAELVVTEVFPYYSFANTTSIMRIYDR
jgi:hypothetical protein